MSNKAMPDTYVHLRPKGRSAFRIAILCALETESKAVRTVFDEVWESPSFGRAANDSNSYTAGRIGEHNVVLAYLPSMGSSASTAVLANFTKSYPLVELALLVGICGGAPNGEDGREILLGDIIIGDSVVRYGYGRRFADGLKRKKSREALSRPTRDGYAFLHKLKSNRRELTKLVQMVQGETTSRLGVEKPVASSDVLFNSPYRHKHQIPGTCKICDDCEAERDGVCDYALKATCAELGCDKSFAVHRERLEKPGSMDSLQLHFGLFASADEVMRSAVDRDSILLNEGAIAFEMEGAGAFDDRATVVIVKSVCDYADSHKNKLWQDFAALTAACALRVMLQYWAPVDQDVPIAHPTIDCRQALRIIRQGCNPEADFEETISSKGELVRDACHWILEHPNCRKWLSTTQSDVLWLCGGPGTGKTMASLTIGESLRQITHESQSLFVQYFCDFQEPYKRSVVYMVRSLIAQILSHRQDLFSVISDQIDYETGDLCDRFGTLWIALSRLVRNLSVICVLDGLDECDDPWLSIFLRKLCNVANTTIPPVTFKLFVSSSSAAEPILSVLHGHAKIDLDSRAERGKVHSGVEKYVRDRLTRIHSPFGGVRKETVELKIEKLVGQAEGSYLWISVLLDSQAHVGALDSVQQFPLPGFNTLIDRTFRRIPAARRLHAVEVLRWVTAAFRPLSLAELAAAVEICDSGLESSENILRRSVLDCVQLVQIKNGVVSFRHKAIRDYLIRSLTDDPNDFQLSEAENHSACAKKCLRVFLEAHFALASDSSQTKNALFEYSRRYWSDHCSLAIQDDHLEKEFTEASAFQLFFESTASIRAWWAWFWAQTPSLRSYAVPEKFTLMHVACALGIKCLVKMALENKKYLRSNPRVMDQRDDTGKTPLCWAAQMGHPLCVRYVVANGASVNGKVGPVGTAVHTAAAYGQKSVLEELKSLGAEIKSLKSPYGSPLQAAAMQGDEVIVDTLLQWTTYGDYEKNEAGKPRGWLGNALQAATVVGSQPLVERFIASGADVNARGAWFSTPLVAASVFGHLHIVQLLLKHGANLRRFAPHSDTLQFQSMDAGNRARLPLRPSKFGLTKRELWNMRNEIDKKHVVKSAMPAIRDNMKEYNDYIKTPADGPRPRGFRAGISFAMRNVMEKQIKQHAATLVEPRSEDNRAGTGGPSSPDLPAKTPEHGAMHAMSSEHLSALTANMPEDTRFALRAKAGQFIRGLTYRDAFEAAQLEDHLEILYMLQDYEKSRSRDTI